MRKALLISYRLLKENLGYTAITALGFGVSISLLLLVVSFVWDRLSYDRFHPDPDRIYRVATETNQVPYPYATSPAPLGRAIASSVSGVESVTHLRPFTRTFVKGTERIPHQAYFVTPSFFDVFGFPVQFGDARSALDEPRSVILSSKMARSLFGTTEVAGASVAMAEGKSFIVRGVINTEKYRTHLQFDALYAAAADSSWDNATLQWTEYKDGYTYLRLGTGASPDGVEAQIQEIASRHWNSETSRLKEEASFIIQPLDAVLFGSGSVNELGGEAIPRFVIYFLGFLSLVVILTAVFNYVSLGAAQSLRRAREIGIRKALGATRGGIAMQFLVESSGIALLAFCVAVASTAGLVPLFNQLEVVQTLNGQISIGVLLDPWFHALGLGIALAVGAAAASYPALSLSGHHPVHALRGDVGKGSAAGGWGRGPSLRQILMGVQLALSIAFIVLAITLYQQSRLLARADYGYPSERILSISVPESASGVLADELRRTSSIQSVAHTSHVPVSGARGVTELRRADAETGFRTTRYMVNPTFFQVMNLKLEKHLPDVYRRFESGGVVLNQVAARKLSGEGASELLGTTIRIGSEHREVIGIVQDFHFRDLKNTVGPLVLQYDPSGFRHLLARTALDDRRAISEELETIWNRVYPSVPFNFSLLQETIAERYMPYRDLMRVLGLIGFFAVLIACLGIMGMTAYNVQQRIREIGIRKTVGATSLQIMGLLLRETAIVLGGGVLVGAPLGAYLNTLWLPHFAQRVEVGSGTYGMAIAVTATLALGTASIQALRGANQDVVLSLNDRDG